jgi:hypothetical protein
MDYHYNKWLLHWNKLGMKFLTGVKGLQKNKYFWPDVEMFMISHQLHFTQVVCGQKQ